MKFAACKAIDNIEPNIITKAWISKEIVPKFINKLNIQRQKNILLWRDKCVVHLSSVSHDLKFTNVFFFYRE